MGEVTAAVMLILVVIWPLLLALGVAFGTTRTVAFRLIPWASLPALATAGLLPDGRLPLPGILIDSALILDDTGRLFLLLNAGLWLASGLLARTHFRAARGSCFAVLLLLAMAGGFSMSLAADALSFFAAATVAGYALCGLLVCDADETAWRAGRVLVVLLVVSDLLVFELLLILSQAAGSVDFMALRQAFESTDMKALSLALLVVGLGIKLGVVGLHYWLAPAFTAAVPAVLPALISFILGAGLLGWLRLLPLGQVQWIVAGGALQWLAWITLGYAMVVGLLQTQVRSMLAHIAVALSALWVTLLGAALVSPQVWSLVAEATIVANLQSGFALTALLLLDRPAADSDTALSRRLFLGVKWLAIWLLSAAPVGVAATLGKADVMVVWQLRGVTVVTAILAIRSLLPAGAVSRLATDLGRSATSVQRSTQVSTATTLLVAGGLTAGALLAAALSLVGRSSSEFWINTSMMSIAALVAWLIFGRFALTLPTLPPGELLVPIGNGLSAVFDRGRRLGNWQLPLWRDAALTLVGRLWFKVHWWRMLAWIEPGLNRWHNVLVLLLLLGLTLAWWGGVG